MKRRKQDEPDTSGQGCAVPGCAEPGNYKAPRSREHMSDYQWLCLEHVRDFNSRWDYFKDMQQEDIEHFRHASLTGHRPTWQREDHVRRMHAARLDALEENLSRFMQWDDETRRQAAWQRLPARERAALSALELESRVSPRALKLHYRKLVKLYHPDLHPDDPQREEKFKQINVAYDYLFKLYGAP